MKLQKNTYSCGIFATINALRALGIKVTERRVKAHTGTTKAQGTNQWGILSALERLEDVGIIAKEHRFDTEDEAWQTLCDLISNGSTAIIAVYKENHWVTAVGINGDRVILCDSDYGKRNKRENGVWIFDRAQLFKRWSASVEDNKFYSIIISKNG